MNDLASLQVVEIQGQESSCLSVAAVGFEMSAVIPDQVLPEVLTNLTCDDSTQVITNIPVNTSVGYVSDILVVHSSAGVETSVPFKAPMTAPNMQDFNNMFLLTTCTLQKTVEGVSNQQQRLDQQNEQLQVQSKRFDLIAEELNLQRQVVAVQHQQITRLEAGQQKQGEQLEKLGEGQKYHGEQLSACLLSLEDLKKAVGVQAPVIGKKIDAIVSSQSSEFGSFPLHLKQVLSLMVSNLMDSKNGFVTCFPTISTDEKGRKTMVFLICIPLLMQGILMFGKLLSKKVTITNLRNLISQHLPLLALTDDLYEVSHLTFPCAQYKGPRGRKPGKLQKEKYCVVVHQNAMLPILQQAQLFARQYGFQEGVLPDEVTKKNFRLAPSKNQMWIGFQSDSYLNNWGDKVNVTALQEDVPAYTEFVKVCHQLNATGSNASNSSSNSISVSSDQSYHFNGLTLILRKSRVNTGGNFPRQVLAPRKEPHMSLVSATHGSDRSSTEIQAISAEKLRQQIERKRKERNDSQAFFAELNDDDADFEDEGLQQASTRARKKAKTPNKEASHSSSEAESSERDSSDVSESDEISGGEGAVGGESESDAVDA